MLYKIYTRLLEKSVKQENPVILGAIGDEKTGNDALIDCLRHDKNFLARIQTLYVSVYNSHPLPVEIVRQLSQEQDLSIKELKKQKVRLAFFVDESFFLPDKEKKKAIVLLLYFQKHDDRRYTQRNIKKAQRIRDNFLKLKAENQLHIEVV